MNSKTVIVGPREHEEGVATVRDMETGEQRTVPLGDLVAELGGRGPA
ncbi:MAG TPA: His/Gly/Thr/Pro-type tRNA ligase C-terminal domain-containing protein [Miltoncostaeaceae bacterium]|nr:His/Gly/Thr/Pro-type tRNA ligase C-terminal domain-containing protein [Miltoncostaeaceae bacterium]